MAVPTGPVSRVVFRCYEELNDFLAPQRRKRDFPLDFVAPTRLRHLIETLRDKGGMPAPGESH